MAGAVRTAIFPVAGLGTRFLPATKATPKELLPVLDTPLIQYAIDEARAVLDNAETNLERFERLYAEKSVSKSQLDDARTARDRALAGRVRAAAQDLGRERLVQRCGAAAGPVSALRQGLARAVHRQARRSVGQMQVQADIGRITLDARTAAAI